MTSLSPRWPMLFDVRSALLCTLLCMTASVAHAQRPAMFGWPAREPDVGTYGTVDGCLWAIESQMEAWTRQQFRADTGALRKVNRTDALPAEVLDMARRCSARVPFEQLFARETLYVREMDNAYQVLLSAGRTRDARAFADRWLAATKASDDTLRRFILTTLARRLVQARPMNLAEAWARATEIDLVKHWSSLGTLGLIWQGAKLVRDTAMTEQVARKMREVAARLPKSVTQSDAWQDPSTGVGQLVLGVLQHDEAPELVDSLRVSTTAYYRYKAALRVAAKLNPDEGAVQARPVVGDSWFPRKPSGPRPAPGVVSVVLVTRDNECQRCHGAVMFVRRLKERFPTVEFTLLTNTKGSHGLVIEPPTPEQEAILTDSIYRKVYGLPATTVVYHTRFWRLPEPDRRRINERDPNDDIYSSWDGMYLIDRAGTIVARDNWASRSSDHFAALVEAVVQQR